MNIFSVHLLHQLTLFALVITICTITQCEAEANRANRVSKRGLPDGSVVNKCPVSWNDPFCSCDINLNTLQVTIHCTSIGKTNQLHDSLNRSWTNKRFEWFLIENSTLSPLPAGIFYGLSFSGFIANYNTLDGIEDNAFQDSEDSAEFIWMSGNTFPSGFNFKSLHCLKNLVSLAIISSHSRLEIPNEAFGPLSHLETINLEKNGIDKLGNNVFVSLLKLRRIDLSWNNLTKLEKNVFNTSGCERPISLILVHNQISEIEEDAFLDLNARYINLEYNKLTTLKRSVFEPLLNSLTKLSNSKVLLHGNPFICDSSFHWLSSKSKKYRQQLQGVPCLEDHRLDDSQFTIADP